MFVLPAPHIVKPCLQAPLPDAQSASLEDQATWGEHMTCKNCADSIGNTYVSVPLSQLNSFTTSAKASLSSPAQDEFVHFGNAGDRIYSATSIDANGRGHIEIRGSIGLLPIAVKVSVEATSKDVSLSLELNEPFHAGPYEWTFDIQGQQLALASSGFPAAAGLDYWCVVKCGGTTILPTLAACLPSIAGGPAAYVACVTAKLAAADAALIAACIASSCVK